MIIDIEISFVYKKNPHKFLHMLIKPQYNMGGAARMFRTSNVLHESRISGQAGNEACS
jgi:hypothetical protein